MQTFDLNPDDALDAVQHAMIFDRGPIGDLDQNLIFQNSYLRLSENAFVFEMSGGARFRYDLGQHLKLDCHDDGLMDECELYQWGTVYGAVGWLNNLVPLHASCVVRSRSAIAFTAESGVGKSTLAAALSSQMFPLLCDDTLMTASCDGIVYALPDGKLPKLSADVADLLRLPKHRPVPLSQNKYYCEPSYRMENPIELRDIVFIEDGPKLSLNHITGSLKLEMLGGALYRSFIHQALHNHYQHAEIMLGLANGLRCWKLQRPRNLHELPQLAERIANLIDENIPE